jgi:predicted phage baseplate assembly protein
VPGSWIGVLQGDGGSAITAHAVVANEIVGANGFGLVQRVSKLTLDRTWAPPPDKDLTGVRAVSLMLQTGTAPLARRPLDPVGDPVGGSTIQLSERPPSLAPGRLLAVSGVTLTGDARGELASVASIGAGPGGDDGIAAVVSLEEPLAGTYRRDAVTVQGNIVPATQGMTWNEVLGSGDPTVAGQTFRLRHAPLTYRPMAAGVLPDLEILVDGVAWTRTDDLTTAPAEGRDYVVDVDETGTATVRFGDGVAGARLPAGIENVSAVYRAGAGAAGNVAPGQLSQLQSRPAGVSGVTNPVPGSGGADAEPADAVRGRAAAGLGALGRPVGLPDYENAARSTPGVGKAVAQLLPVGQTRTVVVTVAGVTAAPLDPQSALIASLHDHLALDSPDPAAPVLVLPRRLSYVCVAARLRVLPDAVWEHVAADATTALAASYSYPTRDLGAGVLLADVVVTLMRVPNVEYVVIDQLAVVDETGTGASLSDRSSGSPPPDRIEGSLAVVTPAGVQAARLLVLDPAQAGTVSLGPLP